MANEKGPLPEPGSARDVVNELYHLFIGGDLDTYQAVQSWLVRKSIHNEPIPATTSLDELNKMRLADEARWQADEQARINAIEDRYKKAMSDPERYGLPGPEEFTTDGLPLTPYAEEWYARKLKNEQENAAWKSIGKGDPGPVDDGGLAPGDDARLSKFFDADPLHNLLDTVYDTHGAAQQAHSMKYWFANSKLPENVEKFNRLQAVEDEARSEYHGFIDQLRVIDPTLAGNIETHLYNLDHNIDERPKPAQQAPAPPAEPDHYDDGHSFGWKQPEESKNWKNLSQSIDLDSEIERIERNMSVDDDEPASTSSKRAVAIGGLLAGLLLVGVVIAAIALSGGDSKKKIATEPIRGSLTFDSPDDATAPVVTAPPVRTLPSACDVVSASTIGQIVGRTMVAKPAIAGSGCVYTTTDTPHIDVTTAYPPFVSQVTLSYNAANGALTSEKVADLFSSSKGAGATSVSGVGERAYSRDGDNGVVTLDRGVMAMVGISSTRRPESLEEVRGYSAAIATKFLTAFPR